jgi:predicted transcriptional regulator
MFRLISPDFEVPKALLIPTEIAKRVGLQNAKLVNLKLIELGLQTKHRDKRLYYKLTEKGLKYGQHQDTGKSQKSGESARAIRWHESVLTLF